MLFDPQPLYKVWRQKGTGSFRPPPVCNPGQLSGVKAPPQVQDSKKTIRKQLEEAIVELNKEAEALRQENQTFREKESAREKQLQQKLETTQERNRELVNNLQAQSRISSQLQRKNDRLKLRINDVVGKFGSMKQQEKRVREKWMQAESTI